MVQAKQGPTKAHPSRFGLAKQKWKPKIEERQQEASVLAHSFK